MYDRKTRKVRDNYDTDQLWRRFRNDKKAIHFNIPTINETRETYKLLKSDKKELYTINFDECEKKRFYWEKILEIYKENDFIIPYSFGLGKEIKFYDIWDYHVTSDEITIVKKIIKLLKKDEDDYFLKEHISFT